MAAHPFSDPRPGESAPGVDSEDADASRAVTGRGCRAFGSPCARASRDRGGDGGGDMTSGAEPRSRLRAGSGRPGPIALGRPDSSAARAELRLLRPPAPRCGRSGVSSPRSLARVMPWTNDELLAVREVALAMARHEAGITPHPAYLPTYERLRERGVLTRKLLDGEPSYRAAEHFKQKAMLMLYQAMAELQARDN